MPNEVQAQVDFIARKYQETLKGFSDLIEKFKALSQEVSSLSSKFDSFKDCPKKVDDFSELLKSQVSSILSSSNSRQNENQANLEKVFNSCDKLNKDSLSTKEFLESSKQRIDSLEKNQTKFSSSAIVVKIEKDLQDLSEKVRVNEEFSKNFLSQPIKNMAEIKSGVQELLNDLKASKKKIDDLFGLFTSLSVEHSALKEKLAREIKSLKDYVEEYVKAQISSIPKPVIPSIDEAKNAFKSQLEPISLDAKNSLIRSQNNESKIVLLEKKVEQLQLLLNKYHLQDQK